jgi:cysteinyl-tRNA synthetase
MRGATYAARVLRLYDTASGEVRELAQRQPGQVDIYLCGPTVTARPTSARSGHARVRRPRRYLGVVWPSGALVSNITDIDDKIIARATREGRGAARSPVVARPLVPGDAGIGVDPPTTSPRHDYVSRWSP